MTPFLLESAICISYFFYSAAPKMCTSTNSDQKKKLHLQTKQRLKYYYMHYTKK